MTKTTTQQLHPWRAAARTAVEVATVLTAALLAIAPLVQEFMATFWPDSPVLPWLAGAVLFLSTLAGLLAKVAALPQVDALLERIGLGSAPHVDGSAPPPPIAGLPSSRAPPAGNGGTARF